MKLSSSVVTSGEKEMHRRVVSRFEQLSLNTNSFEIQERIIGGDEAYLGYENAGG
jgi:hypothetical protein